MVFNEIRTHNISSDKHWLHLGSCKSNYHTITATKAQWVHEVQDKVKELIKYIYFFLF